MAAMKGYRKQEEKEFCQTYQKITDEGRLPNLNTAHASRLESVSIDQEWVWPDASHFAESPYGSFAINGTQRQVHVTHGQEKTHHRFTTHPTEQILG